MVFGFGPIAGRRGLCALGAIACVWLLGARQASAQLVMDKPPEQTEGVAVVERRGAVIPPDIMVRDASGKDRRIAEFFDGERPVILVMAYYTCPLLCTKVLNELQQSINRVSLDLGKDYRIVTVSFDHRDTTDKAAGKRALYLTGYRETVGEQWWEFCTTEPEHSKRLAEAVGYHYRYLPDVAEYAHPSALIFVTPKGVVSSYIENLVFDPRDVKMALMDAGEGRVGGIFDRVVFTCFMYDPKTGKYKIHPMVVMRLIGSATVIGLAATVAGLAWTGSGRRRRRRDEAMRQDGDDAAMSGTVPGGEQKDGGAR